MPAVPLDIWTKMIDPAPADFVLPVSPTAEVDAHEGVRPRPHRRSGRTPGSGVLLISGLLRSNEDRPLTGEEIIGVKVITSPRSVRIEITDAGSGVVLGELRKPRHLAKGWSPHLLSRVADRWGLVYDVESA